MKKIPGFVKIKNPFKKKAHENGETGTQSYEATEPSPTHDVVSERVLRGLGAKLL